MLDQAAIQEAMYTIFRETDATREEIIKDIEKLALQLSVPEIMVATITGHVIWKRLNQAGSAEDLRGYITELVTIIAVVRYYLDQSLGIKYGTSPQAQDGATSGVSSPV